MSKVTSLGLSVNFNRSVGLVHEGDTAEEPIGLNPSFLCYIVANFYEIGKHLVNDCVLDRSSPWKMVKI